MSLKRQRAPSQAPSEKKSRKDKKETEEPKESEQAYLFSQLDAATLRLNALRERLTQLFGDSGNYVLGNAAGNEIINPITNFISNARKSAERLKHLQDED